MFRSNPVIDRFVTFFSLPFCYREIRKLKECKKSRLNLAIDLLTLFYSYKTYPDNYGPCRLWNENKSNWKYYYGSNYQSHQRARLLRNVQPIEYRILFDNKAICERLCKVLNIIMPHTYGTISPDLEYREMIVSWFVNDAAETLIIKPTLGSGGRGIVLAKKLNDEFYILSKSGLTPLKDYDLKEEAVVQEVVKQDKRMAAFSSSSVNTVRVVTMLTKMNSVIILAAIMRCGVGESYVDNVCAGGLGVGVNCETGEIMKYAYDYKGHKHTVHPSSKVVFEGFVIPEWRRIIDMSKKIQQAFPYYRILGMDIALREDGEPVLIEINDSPDLLFMENACGPLLKDERILRAFGEYDLLVNKHQKRLYNCLNKGN